MEQFPLIEKESGINRVAGFEPEREDEILDYFEKTFQENIIDSREKEKTPELKGKNHYWIDPDLIAAIHNKISSKEEEVLREPNVA